MILYYSENGFQKNKTNIMDHKVRAMVKKKTVL